MGSTASALLWTSPVVVDSRVTVAAFPEQISFLRSRD
jgi:hypothetical protein